MASKKMVESKKLLTEVNTLTHNKSRGIWRYHFGIRLREGNVQQSTQTTIILCVLKFDKEGGIIELVAGSVNPE
jgi:hypothetical protein